MFLPMDVVGRHRRRHAGTAPARRPAHRPRTDPAPRLDGTPARLVVRRDRPRCGDRRSHLDPTRLTESAPLSVGGSPGHSPSAVSHVVATSWAWQQSFDEVRHRHRVLLASIRRFRERCSDSTCRPPVDDRCRSRSHVSGRSGPSCGPTRSRPTNTRHRTTPTRTAAVGPPPPRSRQATTGRSGYYEVLLTIDVDGTTRRSHAFFVVRPTADSTNTILLQLATNTWHAYNDFAGRNLYTGNTHVSLQRPMSRGYLFKPPGAGRRVTTTNPPDRDMNTHVGYLRLNHLSPWAGSAGWPDWEEPFLAWAERNGYGIDVITNADLEEHPTIVDRYRLLLSVGHDEYWSGPMRDTVEGFIARGGNVAFFSGNTVAVAGPPGGAGRRRRVGDGRLQGPVQGRSGLRHRPHRRAHEHLVRPPDRPTRRTT